MSNGSKKLFLSAVSSELSRIAKLLSGDLKRPTLDVSVQEDFIVTDGTTLEKLDNYIRRVMASSISSVRPPAPCPKNPPSPRCSSGIPTSAQRLPPLAEALRQPQPGFSYTQWEAYLALYHRRPLFVYRPTDFESDALDVPRDSRFVFDAAEAQSQQEHYLRISALGQDRGLFLNEERLSSAVLRDLVEILPRLESNVAVAPTLSSSHPRRHLIGRDDELTWLDAAWKIRTHNVAYRSRPRREGKTSLVATWVAELRTRDWRGAGTSFAWSFYSQGAARPGWRLRRIVSQCGLHLVRRRLRGDAAGPRGRVRPHLAHVMASGAASSCSTASSHFKYPPPAHTAGQLKDPGIASLLKGLAAPSTRPCVVTTRVSLADMKALRPTAHDSNCFVSPTSPACVCSSYFGVRDAGSEGHPSGDRRTQSAQP